MNTTLTTTRNHSFNVEPVFKIYEQVAGFYTTPTPENIIDYYDLLVRDKLNDLLGESGFDKSLQEIDDEVLGIKAYISMEEMIHLLNNYHMMYIDSYCVPRNIPIKEVW